MRRMIWLALVAVLALAVGTTGVASADVRVDAQAAAKSGKKKCKGKQKSKKAKKAKRCKGKGRGKGAAKTTWPPEDGNYGDEPRAVHIEIINRGRRLRLFVGNQGFEERSCLLLGLEVELPLKSTANVLRAEVENLALRIKKKPKLAYVLEIRHPECSLTITGTFKKVE